ncbi:hypothetical protein J6590_056805 [Homalodisca vitripennis]|nr:hypothetical protein J6590_056805 [Homalodisca vitripennis]
MSHRKCFRNAAHNATPPPLPPITTHSRPHVQVKVQYLTALAAAGNLKHKESMNHVCDGLGALAVV